MRQIYRKATRGIVWLGNDHYLNLYAMEAMALIRYLGHDKKNLHWDPSLQPCDKDVGAQ
jgi:hypothetical protein